MSTVVSVEFFRSKKSYQRSLRYQLRKYYTRQISAIGITDCRWIYGFITAGAHSNLITLPALKDECLSAFREVAGYRMDREEEIQLEGILRNLCARSSI